MIRWTGKSTSGTWRREVEAESMIDLMEKLIDLNIIPAYWDFEERLFGYLADSSEELEEFKTKYNELKEEELFEEADGLFNDFDWANVFRNMDPKDIQTSISLCDSQAYYQTFETI
jgi:hypothetical protein|nr:MAG TPA: hypothetical protein [Caudoviricetes sp.]